LPSIVLDDEAGGLQRRQRLGNYHVAAAQFQDQAVGIPGAGRVPLQEQQQFQGPD
jgi:hypothetical protein